MVHGRHDSAVPSPSFRVHLPSPRRVSRPGECSLCHSPIAVLLHDAVFGIRAVHLEEVDLPLIEFGVARATREMSVTTLLILPSILLSLAHRYARCHVTSAFFSRELGIWEMAGLYEQLLRCV